FRDVGMGVINGPLWTITTEILFYLCVPVIASLERRVRYTVAALTAASFIVYAVGPSVWSAPVYHDKTIYDVLAITPVAWGWMFGFGILAVKHFDRVARGLRYFPWALALMMPMIVLGSGLLFGATGNRLGLAYFTAYIAVVFWLAFGTRYVKLETDLSYGVYVWHMPVINLLLVAASSHSISLAIVSTLL